MAGTWSPDGTSTRTITVSKTAYNNYVYGDDEHGTGSSSERSFACLKNNTEFQHSFLFETPEWITSTLAVSHNDGNNNYYNLRFNISANNGSERTGNIVIKCNDKSLTLTVVQAGESAAFKIYMNSNESFSNMFKAMRINNGNIITPSGTTKSQEIYSSTNPSSDVNIELLPLNNKSIALSYCKGTTHNSDNIEYTNTSLDPVYSTSTFLYNNIKNLHYSNNLITFTSSDDENIWVNTNTNVSTNIKLNSFDAYPSINIYISNLLKLVITINQFDLYIRNNNPGSGYDIGRICSLNDQPLPDDTDKHLVKSDILISSTSSEIVINMRINIPEDDIIHTLEAITNNDIIGEFEFFITLPGQTSSFIDVIVEEDGYIFGLLYSNTCAGLKLKSQIGTHGVMGMEFFQTSAAALNIEIITTGYDLTWNSSIQLKVPTGYRFIYNYDSIYLKINII